MQVKVRINNIGSICLPISYHYLQQSSIYKLIGGNLHNKGAAYGKRDYKLFTFGPFQGKYIVKDKWITFFDNISFEFRCYDAEIMKAFVSNLKKYGFRLGDISYHNIDYKLTERKIEASKVRVKMVSPICVYRTSEDKHVTFFSPEDLTFFELVNDNFKRKYAAAFKENAKEDIEDIVLSVERFNSRDKYITKYKNYFYIEAWKGIYSLSGAPDYLTFLYDTGLGAKNSQGFGMFEIM